MSEAAEDTTTASVKEESDLSLDTDNIAVKEDSHEDSGSVETEKDSVNIKTVSSMSPLLDTDVTEKQTENTDTSEEPLRQDTEKTSLGGI